MTSADETSVGAARSWSAAQSPAPGAPPSAAPPRRRLFRKYALLFIGLVGAALLVNSGFDFWFSYQENQAALIRVQQEKAEAASQRIEEFVDEIKSQIGWTTHAQWSAGPLDQRRQDYFRLLRQVPAITELTQLSNEGRECLTVSRLKMDVIHQECDGPDWSKNPGFIGAKAQRVWFSPVYFRKQSEPYLTLAMAREGRNAGVTIAEINLKLIYDVITALKIGQGGYAYVVDGHGKLLAHPDISLVLRDTDLATLPQVAAALASNTLSSAGGASRVRGQAADSPAVSVAQNIAGRAVLTAHAAIPQLGWLVFVEVPLQEAFAPLYGAAWRTAILLALGLIAAAFAALLLARRMTGPIRVIAEGAERLGGGDLSGRIDIHTGDELEALAQQFNRMAADLQKSYAELEQRVRDRTAELSEALDQQTATAEVLGVINSSPGDLTPVFDAMLEKATSLCDAAFGTLFIYDGELMQAAAIRGASPEYAEYLNRGPFKPRSGGLARLIAGESVAHSLDAADEESYRGGNPHRRALVDLGGGRTHLAVPLRKGDKLLGAFAIYRREVRPFTDKQIALLQNFAAQAVIAMENARLITETREALEQQTATAEVLGVINSSPGDLAPVFDAMLEKATSLCEAAFGILWRFDGELACPSALYRVPPAFAEFWHEPRRPAPDTGPGRMMRGEGVLPITDMTQYPSYVDGDPMARAIVDLAGARSVVIAPLRKDGVTLGAITVYRQEVRPFSDKQIALLQNFAAQAVIAMENARLITETREALEQQTATAEVLGVINSSPGDLAPVFDAMLERALTLCEASFGFLNSYDDKFVPVAQRGVPEPLGAYFKSGMDQPRPGDAHWRLLEGEDLIHGDQKDEDAYRSGNPLRRAVVDLGGARTALVVALRKEEKLLGALTIYRKEVRPFSDKQIALLQNFAAQAVIAMENARLITETREALEQQTATSDILRVVSGSQADVQPVFDAIVENASRLCEAEFSAVTRFHDGQLYLVAINNMSAREMAAFHDLFPRQPTRNFVMGRAFVDGVPVQIDDVLSVADYDSRTIEVLQPVAQYRSCIGVPILRDAGPIGVIFCGRREVKPFTEKQIELVKTFADQAVIAIENARLITETREALEQQTATAEVLGVINASPGDLAPVFDAMLERAMRLCEATMGIMWSFDGRSAHMGAFRNVPQAFCDYLREEPPEIGPETFFGRAITERTVAHTADITAEEPYRSGARLARVAVELTGVRALLMAPLIKDNTVVGVFSIFRKEVRAFSDKQIALLQNFAAQAVIAMENARLITETREALEQQTATAEVLGVINSSPGDLTPVFDAMLEKAMRLCEAAFGQLDTYDGGAFHTRATRGVPAAFAEFRGKNPPQYGPGTGPMRMLAGERVLHQLDMMDDDIYRNGEPNRRALVDLGGARASLQVGLVKDQTFLGFITLFRREVRPFTDKQIALLQNFAAQAVIAMENARLITETREALEQQTATAEVLGVINSSPGDLAPVFDALLDKATALCQASFGLLARFDGERYHAAALHGVPSAFEESWREPRLATPGLALYRLAHGEDVIQIEDVTAEDVYSSGNPIRRALADLGGARTALWVALRKDRTLLGAFVLYRQEVRPFAAKQIELVRTFAEQAVIAIDNARLLNELRDRTRDLQESLEYQTATSDVLKVISRSDAELEPVLENLVETATRLCQADHGYVFRTRADGLHYLSASYGVDTEFREFMSAHPFAPDRGTLSGRVALERRVVHIDDAGSDPEYTWSEAQQRGNLRTGLGVPLLRDDALLGIIVLYRSRVERFTDKQIELASTFADQAVIAIENARLLGALRERTDELAHSVEELKALGEVGQAVSSTLDLAAVLATILNRSVALAGADAGAIFRYSVAQQVFRLAEAVGWNEVLVNRVRELRIAEHETGMGEATRTRRPLQLTDLAERPSYPLRDATLAAGFRSVLIVPLVGAERIFGAIVLERRAAGEFPEAAVRLMQTLASQSVLAIQNARLFREIADKSEELRLASQHKSQFLANMSHELRTPLNAILGYTELMVDGIYGGLPEKAAGVLERVQNNGKHLLALINDVLDLSKIEAGQLVLTLEEYALPDVVQSVVTATEGLASTKGLKMTAEVAPGLPTGRGDARRLSQVLLNLVGNAVKFTDQGEVAIRARAENGHFVLTVRDTGPGIAPEDHGKVFEEFQQVDSSNTRKKGGTGLGLAISKRMVEMQGGSISIESELGHGATFRVSLPIRVEEVAEELMGAA